MPVLVADAGETTVERFVEASERHIHRAWLDGRGAR